MSCSKLFRIIVFFVLFLLALIPFSSGLSFEFDDSFERYNITDFDENKHKHFYKLDSYGRIVKVIEYNNDTVLNISEQYVTTYGYDANDNLILITDSVGNRFEFSYDTLSRKIGMKDPDTGNWSYVYDNVGNLVQQKYGGGNLITGDGYYREYDGQNRLIRIRNGSNSTSPKIEEYFYDFRGNRVKVKKYDSANTTVYTPFRELMVIKNNSGFFNFTYVYKGDKLVARVNPDNSKYFYHADHLGSTSLITNSTGGVVESTSYDSYGNVLSGGNKEKKLYTGQFNDESVDQYYYGARYYDPEIISFIQGDLVIQNSYDPQTLNHFSFVRNNPLKHIDITGKDFIVVNEPSGAFGAGHTYAYVGNEKTGYTIVDFRVPGTDKSNGNIRVEKIPGSYDSERKKDSRILIYETSEEQDENIIAKAEELRESKTQYNLLNYNCDITTSIVGQAGGVEYKQYGNLPVSSGAFSQYLNPARSPNINYELNKKIQDFKKFIDSLKNNGYKKKSDSYVVLKTDGSVVERTNSEGGGYTEKNLGDAK